MEDEVPGGRKRRQAAAKAVKKFVDSDEEEEEAGEKDQPEEDGDAEFKADGRLNRPCNQRFPSFSFVRIGIKRMAQCFIRRFGFIDDVRYNIYD